MSEEKDKVIFKRIQAFFVITIFLCFILVARLAYLQVLEGDYYEQVSEENRMRRITIDPPRGEIYGRDGELLAKNTPGYTVSLMDVGGADEEKVVYFLSDYLEIEEQEIKDKIDSQRFRQFEPIRIKSGLSYEQVAHLAEKRTELPGVILEIQPDRIYTQDKLLGHVLGYTGEITRTQLDRGMGEEGYRPGDIVGQSGLEKTYQEELRGEPGFRQVEVNRFGRVINNMGEEEPIPGNNLHLTIDVELQEFVSESLDHAIETIREEEGEEYEDHLGGASAVVMNPDNGEILSMVSLPKYDPNTLYENYADLIEDSTRPLRNRAISETYPPGSTYKMVTALAALEENELAAEETILDEGRYWNPPRPRNFQNRALGRIDVVDALKYSSNVFFSEMGHRLGINLLSEWSRNFGFGATTGLEDLDGEHTGIVAGVEYKERHFQEAEQQVWYPGETIIAAMGQGYHTYTPLQLANYAAMLANEGIHYRPHLVSEVTDSQGEIVEKTGTETLNELDISQGNWDLVKEGMRQVAQPGGTAGWMFDDLEFDVGLKTGTAEVAGRPSHGWIVGFAPYEDPEIAFSIFIEHGGGSSRVTPVARALIDYYFDLMEEDEEEPEELDMDTDSGYVDE
ncbi:penicillin-binding protein 2 [Natranaerobius thermophilus]|nr:penicillin-binding protein 2 [Natranaerobius thermophilus]